MTFRGYGRRDRPAAEEGLGGPSSSSLFLGLSLDFKPQARCKGCFIFKFIKLYNLEYSLVEPALFVNFTSC
jgi:hypothetical protein